MRKLIFVYLHNIFGYNLAYYQKRTPAGSFKRVWLFFDAMPTVIKVENNGNFM